MEHSKFRGKSFDISDKEIYRDGVRLFSMERARRSPGTRLIVEKEGQVLLTKEFRHERGEYDFRLPGGKVYDTLEEYLEALKNGVSIDEAAKAGVIKEAAEEAGIKVQEVEFLHKSICGMTIEWDLYYFRAKNFSEGTQDLGEGEDIAVIWVDKEDAKKMCLDGRIGEERSALVLLKFLEGKF